MSPVLKLYSPTILATISTALNFHYTLNDSFRLCSDSASAPSSLLLASMPSFSGLTSQQQCFLFSPRFHLKARGQSYLRIRGRTKRMEKQNSLQESSVIGARKASTVIKYFVMTARTKPDASFNLHTFIHQ